MANKPNLRRILSFVAFCGIIAIAGVLLFQLIFHKFSDVTLILRMIGESIAYLITAIYAYNYVNIKRNTVISIIYAISVTAILVLLIFR